MSTNVGLFFAASFPPAESSGKPGRVRSFSGISDFSIVVIGLECGQTFESRLSVNTLQISLCLTTSQARLPSHNSTCETGSLVRRRAYSRAGTAPSGRANGNLGGAAR